MMMAQAPPDAGLGFLGSIDGLYIQQRVELLEAFTSCETKNRYHITPIPAGAIPDPARGTLPETWLQHFRAQNEFAPLLKAKEESECCQRQCCTPIRKFDMAFKDGAGQTFFSIHRPFKCSIPCPCCLVAPQELTLYDAAGVPAAAPRKSSNAAGRARASFRRKRTTRLARPRTKCSTFAWASCTAAAATTASRPLA